jgi:hypothetical protein
MKNETTGWFAWGIGILVVALVARYARELGHVDGETTTRLVIGLTGLMVAWAGNRMPKAIAPDQWIRQARRIGGWSLVSSGLVYAGLWAFAPIPVAKVVGSTAVLLGIAVTFGYCLVLRNRATPEAT